MVSATRRSLFDRRRAVLWVLLAACVLAAALSQAGMRQDPDGNTISGDIIAPGGGSLAINNGDPVRVAIEGTVGQSVVTGSTSASGSMLYHGVQGPTLGAGTTLGARHWHLYDTDESPAR